MRRKLVITSLLLVVLTPFVGKYLPFGCRSSQADDERCYKVERPYYPLRHWNWSGIFPVEGGFITDPHFLCSEPIPVPSTAATMVRGQNASFQIVDVNPFFDDRSSEILLLIRSSDSVFDYSLQFPSRKHVQAVLATPDSPARIFPVKDHLVLLAHFFGPAKGLYLIPLPLRSGTTLSLISAEDPRFEAIATRFKDSAQDRSLRDQFCERQNYGFITFYEKYAVPCDTEAHSVKNRFDEFWKKD
jgi:hypothetical protein